MTGGLLRPILRHTKHKKLNRGSLSHDCPKLKTVDILNGLFVETGRTPVDGCPTVEIIARHKCGKTKKNLESDLGVAQMTQ